MSVPVAQLPLDTLVQLHEFAVGLAASAAHEIANAHPDPSESGTKADAGDWVTPFDRAVERRIRDEIAAAYPEHVVVGEEYGSSGDTTDAQLRWYLDPIDGTTNFVHGLPWASFSLAGYDAAGVAVGVVADAHRGEILSAVRGGGAYLDGRPLGQAASGALAGGVVLTEWSGGRPWPGMFDVLAALTERFAAVRIMGSCALALASVGAGRAVAALLPGRYNLWDVAAGALIARESGALVFDRAGRHDGVPADGILAAAPGAAPELWALWQGAGERQP